MAGGVVAWEGWSDGVNQPPSWVTVVVTLLIAGGLLGMATELIFPYIRSRIAPRVLRVEGARLLDETRTLFSMSDGWWSDWALRSEKWRIAAHETVLRRRSDLGLFSAQAMQSSDLPDWYHGYSGGEERTRIHMMCNVLTGVVEHWSAAETHVGLTKRHPS